MEITGAATRTMTTPLSVPDTFPEPVHEGLALVDYDNVCRREGNSEAEIELRTVELVDKLAREFRVAFPDLKELDVRFYGGWIDELGLPSPVAFQLMQVLPALRGRWYGVIVRPALATAMLRFPGLILRGTVRLHSRSRRQKMVDGMLGCDAMFIAASGTIRVGLVSDDDDLVPAALSACAANTGAMLWMRTRPVGKGLNDQRLIGLGLRIHAFEEYDHGQRA